MTRFDADPSSGGPPESSLTSARGTIARHPGVFIVAIALASLSIALASALLLAGQGARYQLARTIGALQLSVFLQPQVSRADAEGLRGRIEGTPAVVGARLRPREDAMAALVDSGFSSLPTKGNPLPDVWLVTLGPTGADAPTLAARIVNTRLALAALPGVDSVRVDSRWVDLLDRASSWLERGMTVASWIVSALALTSLLGLFFLTGRALAAGGKLGDDRMQALATIGMVSGLASLVLAGGWLWLATALSPDLIVLWRPILDSIGREGHVFLVAMGLSVILVAALGHGLGGSRR